MTVYVRADVASVSVPTGSGGCGQPHSRPVTAGAPAQGTWPITCAQCEPNLRQDIQRSGGKKVRTVNTDHGLKLQERYLGLFAPTPEMVPETPDQEKQREFNEQETARHQAQNQADTFAQIAASMQGNTEVLQKMLELQALLAAQQAQQPVQLVSSEPVEDSNDALDALPLAQCQECSQTFTRSSNKGPAPKRCPACKARAAA